MKKVALALLTLAVLVGGTTLAIAHDYKGHPTNSPVGGGNGSKNVNAIKERNDTVPGWMRRMDKCYFYVTPEEYDLISQYYKLLYGEKGYLENKLFNDRMELFVLKREAKFMNNSSSDIDGRIGELEKEVRTIEKLLNNVDRQIGVVSRIYFSAKTVTPETEVNATVSAKANGWGKFIKQSKRGFSGFFKNASIVPITPPLPPVVESPAPADSGDFWATVEGYEVKKLELSFEILGKADSNQIKLLGEFLAKSDAESLSIIKADVEDESIAEMIKEAEAFEVSFKDVAKEFKGCLGLHRRIPWRFWVAPVFPETRISMLPFLPPGLVHALEKAHMSGLLGERGMIPIPI